MPKPSQNIVIDNYSLEETLNITDAYEADRYGYLVTPNVDHMIRFCEDATFRSAYASAEYVLLDSQFIAKLLRILRKKYFKVCTGSDLTRHLFHSTVQQNDHIVIIGSSRSQIAEMKKQFGLSRVSHYNPPMGFIRETDEVERCLEFIESASPFRFCFLAIGSPQQELIAHRLKTRGHARGLALCIGASIDFLTGREKRAPRFMQRWGIEWLFRLLSDPVRLFHRYLIRGPKFFLLLKDLEISARAQNARDEDK